MTCLMMGSIFALEWGFGWLRVESFAWQTESVGAVARGVLLFAAICVLVGWKEELMSRGYHLQTVASGTSLAWGWVLSSAVFGLLHLANPHANLLSVAGIILAGLFLGYAYIRTGSLWLSIGLHTGWNFFEGVVFGFPVSGLSFYTLPRIAVSGPVLWTGGEFGPEAGMVLIPALVIGFVLIFLYAKDRSINVRSMITAKIALFDLGNTLFHDSPAAWPRVYRRAEAALWRALRRGRSSRTGGGDVRGPRYSAELLLRAPRRGH